MEDCYSLAHGVDAALIRPSTYPDSQYQFFRAGPGLQAHRSSGDGRYVGEIDRSVGILDVLSL